MGVQEGRRGTHPFSDLVRKMLELLVQCTPPLHFALFQLDFVFVAVSVLPLTVTGFIELDVGSFAINLHILRSQMSVLIDIGE